MGLSVKIAVCSVDWYAISCGVFLLRLLFFSISGQPSFKWFSGNTPLSQLAGDAHLSQVKGYTSLVLITFLR